MMNPEGGVVMTGHNHGKMQSEKHEEMPGMHAANLTQESFKVAGNCSMCEERIEEAAIKLDGVSSADWNQDTKMVHVFFNKEKVSLKDIHKAIAQAGHDTEQENAPDSVYDNLPSCCQYKR